MKGIVKRTITACVALPILIVSSLLFPQYHFPILMAIIVAAISFGTYEISEMVKKKGRISPISYLAPLLPICTFIEQYLDVEEPFTYFLFIILSALIFSFEVFKGAHDDFVDSINSSARSLLVLTYPALLSSFMVDILFLENASPHIILYFSFVFGEDTFAYFSGILFGRNNSGVVKVSPKKSIAGFIGGILVPSIFGFLAPILFPSAFFFSSFKGMILGAVTAIFGALGDLVESTFKRSAKVKDSGIIVPGRGGILDSLDSLLFAAAPFSILVTLFEML